MTGVTGPLPPRPGGFALVDEIAIDAPPERVWEVLARVEGWGAWNPVYPAASGTLVEDSPLALTVQLPGNKPLAMKATITAVAPPAALQFGASALGGLLRAVRFIEIHPIGDGTSCRVVNGEALSGPLAFLFKRISEPAIGKGLKQQNAGLKAAAEG